MLREEDLQRMRAFLQGYGRHKGHLSPAQISDGIHACIRNAQNLIEDAQILLDAGRPARALSLALTSLEESGKVRILLAMARIPKENQKIWRDKWRSFRDHLRKGTLGMMETWEIDGPIDESLLVHAVSAQRNIAPVTERTRQIGLYVDYSSGLKRWCGPSDVTVRDSQRAIGWAAQAVENLDGLRAIGLTSARALELQRETVGPLLVAYPREQELTHEHIQALGQKRDQVFLEYYRKLLDEGIAPADLFVPSYGKTLGALVRDGLSGS